MRKKLTIISALAAVGCMCLFSADTESESARIKEIRERHKIMQDLSRSGIQAGYLACQLGLSLTNYLANVEKEWDKNLAAAIAEARR